MKDIYEDQYVFDQSPPSTEPGFVVFQAAHEGSFYWFFHCNDLEGMPLLFSQPYLSMDSARKGMESAIKNIQKKNIKIIKANDLFHLAVFAGNHQEVARSKAVEIQVACDEYLEYLNNVSVSRNPEVILNASKKIKEMETNKLDQAVDSEFLSSSSRHTFQIKFYEKSGDSIYGTISHLGTGDHKLLIGLNMKDIADFIRQKSMFFKEEDNSGLEDKPMDNIAESKQISSITPQPKVTSSIRKIVLGSPSPIVKSDIDMQTSELIQVVPSNIPPVLEVIGVTSNPQAIKEIHNETLNIPRKPRQIVKQKSANLLDEFTKGMVAQVMGLPNSQPTKLEEKPTLIEKHKEIGLQFNPIEVNKYFAWAESVTAPAVHAKVLDKSTKNLHLPRDMRSSIVKVEKGQVTSNNKSPKEPIAKVQRLIAVRVK